MLGRKYSKKEKRESESFMSGVLVLSISTVIVKLIGLAYKIPMLSYLGAEGMGYFNSAYEIYAMLCVISTAGLPVALSMLVSACRERGDFAQIHRMRRSALSLFFFIGAVGSVGMILFSKSIASWIGNEQAVPCLIAIAPALLFVCLSSAFRGYFQGFHQMAPTAVSQLIEAIGKLVFGILLATFALRRGWALPMVSAAAIFGISLGTLISTLYLTGVHLYHRDNIKKEHREDHGQGSPSLLLLIRISIPITLSSAVLSVTRLSDMALIMRRLQVLGLSVSEANRIYGTYTTMAIPIFSLIPALITPVALALVPQLSAAIEGGAEQRQHAFVERAMKLTALFSIPAGIGICVYAKPILSMLFPAEGEAVAVATPLLSMLGPSIFFSGMITTTNAMLQSYRRETLPIVSMTVGALVKMVSAYILIGIPSVGVMGAPISTFLCNGVVMILNLCFLRGCFGNKRLPLGVGRVFYKPLLAASVAIAASLPSYAWFFRVTEGEALAFLFALGVTAILYFTLIVLLKVLTKEDLSFLPLKRIDKKIDKEVTKEISDDRTRKERDVAEKRKL